jgi:endoglucanase
MHGTRLSIVGAAAVLALAASTGVAGAQGQVKNQGVPGPDLATPSGLNFRVSAVPNLERDCGATASTGPIQPADPKGANPAAANPLANDRFFVDPTERSYKDMMIYRSRGKATDAAAMSRLALQPKAHWFGRYTRPNMPRKVRNYLNCVQRFQPGATPLMVVQRTQGKECNSHYTAGGKAEDRRNEAWYRDFARAVGNHRVVLAYEPDSIGTISCLAKSRRKARKDVLRYGVDVLSKLPNATIYLEGTASDWKSPAFTAGMLKYMGISKVRGFMLNVTHHDWTSNNIAYGRKVQRRVGGKPFVVSTSYNGRGPVHYKLGKAGRYRRVNVYCNPRYRGLGPAPTTATGVPGVDGFLYLNRPGVSGAGSCNGGFQAGKWWASRALMYARYASEQLGPQQGEHFGLPFRVSLCKLGAPIKGENTYSRVSPEKRCKH